MINKAYSKYKYRRTYIGGSRKLELASIISAQGYNEDNSDCNWIEYNRQLSEIFYDRLHVLFSWKSLSTELFQILTLLYIIPSNSSIRITISTAMVLSLIASITLSHYLNKKLKIYNICISISHIELFKQTGIKLS